MYYRMFGLTTHREACFIVTVYDENIRTTLKRKWLWGLGVPHAQKHRTTMAPCPKFLMLKAVLTKACIVPHSADKH